MEIRNCLRVKQKSRILAKILILDDNAKKYKSMNDKTDLSTIFLNFLSLTDVATISLSLGIIRKYPVINSFIK